MWCLDALAVGKSYSPQKNPVIKKTSSSHQTVCTILDVYGLVCAIAPISPASQCFLASGSWMRGVLCRLQIHNQWIQAGVGIIALKQQVIDVKCKLKCKVLGIRNCHFVQAKCNACPQVIIRTVMHSSAKHVPTHRRMMGEKAASFEIDDRPIFENFMNGIGFAYAVSLISRLFSTATLIKFWNFGDSF